MNESECKVYCRPVTVPKAKQTTVCRFSSVWPWKAPPQTSEGIATHAQCKQSGIKIPAYTLDQMSNVIHDSLTLSKWPDRVCTTYNNSNALANPQTQRQIRPKQIWHITKDPSSVAKQPQSDSVVIPSNRSITVICVYRNWKMDTCFVKNAWLRIW